MPNVDWSPIDISSMSMFSVVDFNTTGAVRLHVWYFQALLSSSWRASVAH